MSIPLATITPAVPIEPPRALHRLQLGSPEPVEFPDDVVPNIVFTPGIVVPAPSVALRGEVEKRL